MLIDTHDCRGKITVQPENEVDEFFIQNNTEALCKILLMSTENNMLDKASMLSMRSRIKSLFKSYSYKCGIDVSDFDTRYPVRIEFPK